MQLQEERPLSSRWHRSCKRYRLQGRHHHHIWDKKIYIRMTEHTFKTRYNNHKLSFSHRNHSHDTILSKYIWDQKDNGTMQLHDQTVHYQRANPYHGHPSRCNLCSSEKLCILSADKSTLLNKRSELITKCRHENKFYAVNQRQDRSNRPP